MDLDPVLLSRLQFAWVIGWHILLPAFTIGMASYIAILEGMHLVTGRSVYLRISMSQARAISGSRLSMTPRQLRGFEKPT